MNSLFNSALRQSTSIRKDLDAFADSSTLSPALLGQINASLTSFSRTIDDYNRLAKQEMVPEKQEKAYERIKNFRNELCEYKDQFGKLKKESDDRQSVQTRTELLGRRPHHAHTPENPYASTSNAQHSPWAPAAGPSSLGAGPSDYTREAHAFREQSFASHANAQLDEFLERGRAVLADLGDQRDVLKGTQRKLYSVANTLGISGDTIRMVERRARQDKWIFWGGVVIFFLFCWLVLHFLK
ncbi:membrin [Phyllosticta citricarpa]|uniref:Protein transport protein BOS1 n=2 Tax=Phyllosticta TaxID=121621 RepID=A0ABR1MGI3_9PEZI